MKIFKHIKDYKGFFIFLLILTLIIHPKPICGATHIAGWSCIPEPLIWLFMGIPDSFYIITSLPVFGSIMFIFDLFLLLIIPFITINAFRFVREKWFEKLNSKFLQILLLIALWFLVWFILGLPYRLVTITDWNFPIYFPMSGGYE